MSEDIKKLINGAESLMNRYATIQENRENWDREAMNKLLLAIAKILLHDYPPKDTSPKEPNDE